MVTPKRTLRRRLPVYGKQGVEVVLGGHSRQSGEDVAEVGQGIDPAALAGHDDRVHDRCAVAGVRVADEEPVFLSDGRGPDRVFDEVVVQAGFPVLEVPLERLPVFEEVSDSRRLPRPRAACGRAGGMCQGGGIRGRGVRPR